MFERKWGKESPTWATKFNRKTGVQVGDWILPSFIVAVIEEEVIEETLVEHITTKTINGKEKTVSIKTSYNVPKKGDVLNIYGHKHTLTEDMKLGLKWKWNEDKKEYDITPATSSIDGSPVFYADGFSLRITD